LPYKPGPFPKPWVKITKTYDCPSPHISSDTTATDSLDDIEGDTTKKIEPQQQAPAPDNGGQDSPPGQDQ